MTDDVLVAREGDVWTVTLNRPDKANALTSGMLNRLADIADEAEDATVFILTGIGKVFSAGADLADVGSGLATDPAWERLSGNIAQIKGLTVAALNGTVAGGAFGMVLACNLRIAVPQARFFYPVMKVGVLPQPSDPGRMAKLIGPARARIILMAGQKIDAETALAWGLIDRIAQDGALKEEVEALTADARAADRALVHSINKMV